MKTTRDHDASGSRSGSSLSSFPGKRSLTDALLAPVQRKASAPDASPDDGAATGASGGLPGPVRADMEASFGADFSAVRVHEDGAAEQMGAEAYTRGHDIHFASGRYQPDTPAGRELLGHELGHVVQQAQGRVAATTQARGAAINDDHALEAEADAAGAQAARGERVTAGGLGDLGDLPEPGVHAVQRKVTFTGAAAAPSVDEVIDRLRAHGVLDRFAEIHADVMTSKPEALQGKPELQAPPPESAEQVVRDWFAYGDQTFAYEDSPAASEKLLRHAIKFKLSSPQHGWRSIGVAEYMTGDATGLALAPTVDPALTVKVLTGKQQRTPEEIEGPTFLQDDHTRLPGYFGKAEASQQVVLSDTDDKAGYAGTSDRYNKHYNEHSGKPIKPWNKETYEATRVVGEALKDPAQTDILRQQIQIGNTPEDDIAKEKIAEYKQTKLDPVIDGRKCLFLWGRTSGQKGGAHKELDSHKVMMLQLASALQGEFADRVLVIVGDQVVDRAEFLEAGVPEDRLVFLGPFWNDDTYGTYMKERNRQRYLFGLFDAQNDAVSIGMRSGSLEGMALLGMRVIFIDDRGNNAAGRMEYWAGGAAEGRAAAYKDKGSEERSAYEVGTQGPLPNYKRVATLQHMGDRIDARAEQLAAARARLDEIRDGKDALDQPICNDAGSKNGDRIMDAVLEAPGAAEILTSTMPANPADVRAFFKALEALTNSIGSSGYAGRAGEDKPSSFRFNRDDLAAIRRALEGLGGDGAAALEIVDGLADKEDVTHASLVHDEPTSPSALGLLGTLKTKGDGIDASDAAGFVARHVKQSGGFAGKSVAGKAGTKFKTASVDRVRGAVTFLSDRNALQPEELDQITTLTRQLAPDEP
jgi:hypothetical protein